MTSVSVIIPTYNRADLVCEAIDSVLAQHYPEIEVIVADDGSTDETASRITRYESAVHYLALPHRGQPAATRNAGLAMAHGDYIGFLDSDDLYLANKLAMQAAALDAHQEVGMVYSDGLYFADQPHNIRGRILDGLPSPSGYVFGDLLRGNFLAPPTVLVRRACLDQVGFFDESPAVVAVEDFDLWLRIAAAYPLLFVPGDVAAIRRHEHSISRDTARLRGRVLTVLTKMDRLYPDLMVADHDARHEAYARSHGAVAMASLRQSSYLTAATQGLSALSHMVRMSQFGLHAFQAWRQRTKIRTGSQR